MLRNNRHFLTDAVIYGIGGVAIQLASVVLLPLYTHYLAPSDYGVMEVIERIGQIINICLMTSGVRQATFAFYLQAANQAERERVAVTITAFLVAIFSLAGATTLALAPILAPLLGIVNPWLLVFGVLTILAELFLVIPLCLMQARVESLAYVTITFLMLVVRVGLAIIFVAVLGWGVWGVYGSLMITFVTFGSLLTARELKKGSLVVDWQKCKEIVRFSPPFCQRAYVSLLSTIVTGSFLLVRQGQPLWAFMPWAAKSPQLPGSSPCSLFSASGRPACMRLLQNLMRRISPDGC